MKKKTNSETKNDLGNSKSLSSGIEPVPLVPDMSTWPDTWRLVRKAPRKSKATTAPKGQSEEQLQAECYQWFHNTLPALRGLLFHIPNGGNRSEREGAKFKAMGVVAGIPDMMLCVPVSTCSNKNNGAFHGLFIEMKTTTGKLSEAQIKAHKRLIDAWYDVQVCNSFELFKSLITIHIRMSPYAYLL